MPVTRAVALLAILCGCSLRAPRVDSAPCSTSRQCEHESVCYLGECRGRSAALATVVAEVRPPNDSQLGLLQRANIDLHSSVVADFALQPLLKVSGVVVQEQDVGGVLAPVAGASVTFTDHAPAIPDRVQTIAAHTDTNGAFTSPGLPSSSWDALVQPPNGLPPLRQSNAVSAATQGLELRLPRVRDLSRVSGTLSAGGVPLDGARVVAVDLAGEPISVPATSADGGFALLLPPGPPPFRLEVGPGTAADGGNAAAPVDPLPSFEPFGQPSGAPFMTTVPISQAFDALPPPAVVQGRVVDQFGASIPGARVSAASLGPAGWTLARLTVAVDGTFWLALREGSYVIEAAPGASATAPGVSGELPLKVLGGTSTPPLVITCPPKLKATGFVLLPDGRRAGAGHEITATRLPDRLLTGRPATATATDSGGAFHLVGDAGRYRLEVVPPAGTQLPRKIVQIDLGGDGSSEIMLPPLQLSPALLVVGTVHGALPGGKDLPVAGATVDFFAIDGSGARTLFLGSGLTDASGHYSAVVPDVPQAGLLP